MTTNDLSTEGQQLPTNITPPPLYSSLCEAARKKPGCNACAGIEEAERRIVEWLRSETERLVAEAMEQRAEGFDAIYEDMKWAAMAYSGAADAIERGEHRA